MDRIDHKDEPGEYRMAVFREVQKVLGFLGERPRDRSVFFGEWLRRFGNSYTIGTEQPTSRHWFAPDGSAPGKALDGRWSRPRDGWEYNEDGSFSLWAYVEPMPEYGLDEPTYSEERYHVLMKGENEFVLFNGDGSLIHVYTREHSCS